MLLLAFEKIGRLPDLNDNAAITVCDVDAGTQVAYLDRKLEISQQIPVAHHFCSEPNQRG